MNIPDEAVEALQKAEEETDPAWATYWTQRSQALSQMALVEAQEAANEQARIANLIALTEWGYRINSKAEWFDQATDALLTGALFIDDSPVLQPEIARALGIGGAE